MSSHLPVRPSWVCGGCGEAWPCKPARVALVTEHLNDLTALRVYLSAQLSDAAADLPNARAGVLYRRFMGWLR